MAEHELQCGIARTLNLSLRMDWRLVASLNGAHLTHGGRQWAKLARSGAAPGFPDLTLFGDGKIRFFEVKLPGKKLEPQQEDWARYLREQGHEHAVITSIEEMVEGCRAYGAFARDVTIRK